MGGDVFACCGSELPIASEEKGSSLPPPAYMPCMS
jgi:hypothetical protein